MVTWTKRELLVVKINPSQLLKFLMNKKRSQIIIHSATLHTFLSLFPHFSPNSYSQVTYALSRYNIHWTSTATYTRSNFGSPFHPLPHTRRQVSRSEFGKDRAHKQRKQAEQPGWIVNTPDNIISPCCVTSNEVDIFRMKITRQSCKLLPLIIILIYSCWPCSCYCAKRISI